MSKHVMKLIVVLLAIALTVSVALCGIAYFDYPGVFDQDAIPLGLDLSGGSLLVFEADTKESPSADDMNAVISMMRSRLDTLGYTEAAVTKSGEKRIQIEIPEISDPGEASAKLGATAVLTFRNADGDIVLDGDDIAGAKAQYGPTSSVSGKYEHYVSVTLTSAAVSKFSAATTAAAAQSASKKNYISIMLDENVISQPYVSETITSSDIMISGSFDEAGASYLAGVIAAGRLPFALKEIQAQSLSPQLGESALTSSLIAGGIGVILVMLFMMLVYKMPGFVASIALLEYTAIVAILLVMFRINLSLSGIAGIVLSIGMAVDANCVIFERIKEELRLGRSVPTAVTGGFKRAFTAILDSNITTLIACFVLYFFGTGFILSFAQTLFIGVVVSMFSAIVITRSLLKLAVKLKFNQSRYFGVKREEAAK